MANEFNSIQISGALLSNEFVQSCTRPGGTFDAFAASTFDPSWKRSEDFERGLTHAWEGARDRFDAIERELPTMDVSDVRERWILPLLRLLGFRPVYQKANTMISGTNLAFRISHRGWDGPEAPAIQVLAPEAELDTKPAERGSKSPQADLQAYLNQDAWQSWALLTNGVQLRLLRDYFHTSQPGYVQFDLLQMLITRDLDEFRALFRLAHASRWLPHGSDATVEEAEAGEVDLDAQDDGGELDAEVEDVDASQPAIRLEQYFQHSRAQGSRAEGDLRGSVKNALEVLGDGLLDDRMRTRLAEQGELDEYYRQILRVVYRWVSVLFAEQRGLVPNGQAEHSELYLDEYSLTALRELAEEASYVRDDGRDLWERLLLTFDLAHRGSAELGIQAFNGALFDPTRTRLITGGVTDSAERNVRDDLPSLDNPTMVRFIEHLAFVERKGLGRERINYRDLRVEEIGHIYEGLLDYAPGVANEDVELDDRIVPRGEFFLDDRGTERKTSGSYYTPKELVQEVIARTLLPVIENRLEAAKSDPKAQEETLLGIRVLDPACGSAAFLIAANDALATRLADIRWDAASQNRLTDRAETLRLQGTTALFQDVSEPSYQVKYQDELNHARRDVLSHCIYGVDLNDMAVELAKVALWIHAAEAGKPLSFLDHRIRHGNSLVGAPVDFPRLGIHPDAFKGRGDHDKERLKSLRKVFTPKQAKEHRERQAGLFDLDIELPDLDAIQERSVADVRRKRTLFEMYHQHEVYTKWLRLADYWTAAFFHPVHNDGLHVPNQLGLSTLLQDYESIVSGERRHGGFDPALWDRVEELRGEHTFFHYWLEFPEAFFDEHGKHLEAPGFDAIVGNPPWEKIMSLEREFFNSVPEIANEKRSNLRKKRIEALASTNPALYSAWQERRLKDTAEVNFLRSAGRFARSAVGELNLYPIFVELSSRLVSPWGGVGLIVKSGMLNSTTWSDFTAHLIESGQLKAAFDFRNWRGWFPGVGYHERFTLLFLSGGVSEELLQFAFYLDDPAEIGAPDRSFSITRHEALLLNPETKSPPTFKSGRDKDVTLEIYERFPVLGDSDNGWQLRYTRGFDMSNDSSRFRDLEDLQGIGGELGAGCHFVIRGTEYVPLYEGKYLHQYDHRFRSYEGIPSAKRFGIKAATHVPTDVQKADPAYEVMPRYWVSREDQRANANSRGVLHPWVVTFRDTTNVISNVRTAVSSIVCDTASGNTAPNLVLDGEPVETALLFVGLMNSIPFDYVVRQKFYGAHLLKSILMQIAAPTPEDLSRFRSRIVQSVFELVYTSWSLKPVADALGSVAAPFAWETDRRRVLQDELNAIFFTVYGVPRDDVPHIFDAFPILKKRDIETFGYYRTRDEVLRLLADGRFSPGSRVVLER